MYKKIFEPGKIGTLSLENRLIVPAMSSLLSNADGTPSEEMMAYYERKARGGWGMVITENIKIAPHGGASVKLPGLWEDSQVESHRALVQRVHTAGGKLCAQIYHAGAQASRAVSGVQPAAPSPLCLAGCAPAWKLFEAVKVARKNADDPAPARSYQDYVVSVDETALPAGITCQRMG